MNEEHSSQGRVPRAIRVPSGGLWALWFVVASLVGLVVMHFYQGQRATELENRNSTVLEEAPDSTIGGFSLEWRSVLSEAVCGSDCG